MYSCQFVHLEERAISLLLHVEISQEVMMFFKRKRKRAQEEIFASYGWWDKGLFLFQPVPFFLSGHGAFFNSLGKTLFFGTLLLATGRNTSLTAI